MQASDMVNTEASNNIGGTNPNSMWLVEIRAKDWIHVTDSKTRTITYEEVIASDEIAARHIGFDQFSQRVPVDPILRRRFEAWGNELRDYCAPAAVML